jgi:hypothetical protein
MAERSLRGTSIGSKSLESDVGVDFASRHDVAYVCPDGHRTIVPFSTDAEIPEKWECRCGKIAVRENADDSDSDDGSDSKKPQRTHWDMLLERRTIPELQALLEKRLTMHREGWFPDYE